MFTIPMMQPQQIVETWSKLTTEQLARMTELSTELAELQANALGRTLSAIDESARLMKDSMTATAKLADDWRTLTLENGRKVVESLRTVTDAPKA
jgi:hypothetical protein